MDLIRELSVQQRVNFYNRDSVESEGASITPVRRNCQNLETLIDSIGNEVEDLELLDECTGCTNWNGDSQHQADHVNFDVADNINNCQNRRIVMTPGLRHPPIRHRNLANSKMPGCIMKRSCSLNKLKAKMIELRKEAVRIKQVERRYRRNACNH